MQITIDTQRDSHADIRKAVRMIMSLVGDKEVCTNEEPKGSVFSEEKSSAADAFANLFGSSEKDGYPELTIPKKDKKEGFGGIELY